jgi:hypothetical protein
MKTKLKGCLWIHIFVPLAILLVRIGITRSRWLWQVVHFFSPRMAGFCIIMEDSILPENTLLWYWQEGDPEDDLESVEATLADIDEMINRAPVPFGGDEFIIMIRKYGSLPEEKHLYNFEYNEDVERFLNNHSLAGAWNHRGNRWRDWKRGEAKMHLFDTLIKAEPNSIEPLTIIGVVIIGRGVARSILLSQGKTPSF